MDGDRVFVGAWDRAHVPGRVMCQVPRFLGIHTRNLTLGRSLRILDIELGFGSNPLVVESRWLTTLAACAD